MNDFNRPAYVTALNGLLAAATDEQLDRLWSMLHSQKPPVEAYYTNGQPAKPFIKPAVADHADKYMKILRDELKGK